MTLNATDPKTTAPTREQSTLVLLFSIDKYDRADLDRMDCKELLEQARQAREPDVLIYNVEEFCEASNDEQFSNDAYWLYNVCVEGRVETWRGTAATKPTKYAVGYASVTQGDLYVETMGVYDDMETAKARLEEVKEDLLGEYAEERWTLESRSNGFELRRPYDEDAIQVAISEINHARQV